MENYVLENDIKVFYVTASSFPDGVMEAHQKLHSLAPVTPGRKYFGLSRPAEKGEIIYLAATEETHAGEAEEKGCQSLVIRKGNYLSILIENYMQDIPSIGKAFQQMISQPGIDPNGYCVEWYFNDRDLRCMVRLDSDKK